MDHPQQDSPAPQRPVLRMSKKIDVSASRLDARWKVRTYSDQRDLDAWLEIVNSAFGARKGGRDWHRHDATRELLQAPGWDPHACWFATATSSPVGASPVATVFVAPLTAGATVAPAAWRMRWLAVRPEAQRQGAASCLLQSAEQYVWDHGGRSVEAETLATWVPAVRFYQHHGYRVAE